MGVLFEVSQRLHVLVSISAEPRIPSLGEDLFQKLAAYLHRQRFEVYSEPKCFSVAVLLARTALVASFELSVWWLMFAQRV